MKTITLAAISIACICSAAAANAETFTTSSASNLDSMVMVPQEGGAPLVAVMISGKSTATYPGGKKSVSDFKCSNWSTPGGRFSSEGICQGTDPTGTYGLAFSCVESKTDAHAADCWGGLVGATGAYKGRTGTTSWHATNSADGKTGLSNGTGQWN